MYFLLFYTRIHQRVVSYILEKMRVNVSETYRIRYTYPYSCFIDGTKKRFHLLHFPHRQQLLQPLKVPIFRLD
ncbi:unnamed protein product [Lupinus luteus]|uniref:Uncharacterized protein n=1 Tax=Lupinus luteus TaxID=3873 RepID=A0AAV1WPR7_LUPLU